MQQGSGEIRAPFYFIRRVLAVHRRGQCDGSIVKTDGIDRKARFQLLVEVSYTRHVEIFRSSATHRPKHMKNNIISQTVIPGLIAAAVILLSFRSPITAESVVAYGSIAMLLGVVALEYRISWKKLFGR